MAADPNLNIFYTIDIDTNGNLYVLSNTQDDSVCGLYYAKLNSLDGLIEFNKAITTNGFDTVWYSAGHKALVHSDDSILITGYSYATASSSGSDVIAIKVADEDIISDGNYDRWTITTPLVYQVVLPIFDVVDSGFVPVAASIILESKSRVIIDSPITGDEITVLGGSSNFKTKIEGGLNMNDKYELPSIGGLPGQVLKYPSIGHRLVWGTGGGNQNLQQVLDAGNTASNQRIDIFSQNGYGYNYNSRLDSYGVCANSTYYSNTYRTRLNSYGVYSTNDYGQTSIIEGGFANVSTSGIGRTTILSGSVMLSDYANGGSVILNGTFTGSNIAAIQDRSGTIAYLDDITGVSGTLEEVLTNGHTASQDIVLTYGDGTIYLEPNSGFPQILLWKLGVDNATFLTTDTLGFHNNANNLHILSYTLSNSRTQIFQDKDGVIATLDDITSANDLQSVLTAGYVASVGGINTITLDDTTGNIKLSGAGNNFADNYIYSDGAGFQVNSTTTDNSIYIIADDGIGRTEIRYSQNTGSENLHLIAPVLSRDRTQTYQDADGTIALLSDIISITGSVGTLQLVTDNGATTSNDITISGPSQSKIILSNTSGVSNALVKVQDANDAFSLMLDSGDATQGAGAPVIHFHGTSSNVTHLWGGNPINGINNIYLPNDTGFVPVINNNFNGYNILPKMWVGSDLKNGGGTAYSISHSMGHTPSFVSVTPTSLAASQQHYVLTSTSTAINLVYATATPAVSNNMSWTYMVYFIG